MKAWRESRFFLTKNACENEKYDVCSKYKMNYEVIILLLNILNFKIMNKEEIKKKLLRVVSNRVSKQMLREWKEYTFGASDVTLDSSLSNDLCMDSLDRIELAMDIEKAFSLPRLSDEKIEKWVRVADSYQTVCEVLKVA